MTPFKSFRHEHSFEEKEGITRMKDIFEYTAPLRFLGSIADYLFLKRYLVKLLEKRNQIIKEFAETDQWKKVLS